MTISVTPLVGYSNILRVLPNLDANSTIWKPWPCDKRQRSPLIFVYSQFPAAQRVGSIDKFGSGSVVSFRRQDDRIAQPIAEHSQSHMSAALTQFTYAVFIQVNLEIRIKSDEATVISTMMQRAKRY